MPPWSYLLHRTTLSWNVRTVFGPSGKARTVYTQNGQEWRDTGDVQCCLLLHRTCHLYIHTKYHTKRAKISFFAESFLSHSLVLFYFLRIMTNAISRWTGCFFLPFITLDGSVSIVYVFTFMSWHMPPDGWAYFFSGSHTLIMDLPMMANLRSLIGQGV